MAVSDYHKCILNAPLSGTAFFYALMSHKLYLDESGDLGWTLDKPFRSGGSSQFLSIAYIIVPNEQIKYCNRVVRDIYTLFNVQSNVELKGTSMNEQQKLIAAGKIVKMLKDKPDMCIGAITVKKKNVRYHLREDGNILYNYMIGLSTLNKIQTFGQVEMVRDKRSVKVKSGNSCIDYLKIKLGFDMKSDTILVDNPTESHTELNIMFIDWVANFVWSHYEDGKSDAFNRLTGVLNNQELFFLATV